MFEITLLQRAFFAALIIGFTNGYASAYVLINRSPLKLTALSHSVLPGVALAALVVGISSLSVFFGAVVIAIAIGLFSILIARRTKLSEDTSLCILYTGAFAWGLIMLNYLGENQELEKYLLGDIIAMTNMDIIMSFVIGLVAIILLTLFRRPILLTVFEPEVAQTLGVPVRLVNYAGFALLILVLVTTLQAVGCILAIGMIVTPGATIRLFSNKPNTIFFASGILGGLGSALGLVLSYYCDFPASASIIMTLTLSFILAWLFRASLTFLRKKNTLNL